MHFVRRKLFLFLEYENISEWNSLYYIADEEGEEKKGMEAGFAW